MVQRHFVAMRSRRQKSVLAFLAQDLDGRAFCYSNADLRKGEEAEEIFNFISFWKRVHGAEPRHLAFDSRLTTHANLVRLDDMNIRFMTLRARSSKLLEEVAQVPRSAWREVELDVPTRKYRFPKVYDHTARIAGRDFRQMLDKEGANIDAVIVATGARANYLGLPSEDQFKNRGVSACAVCDGALPRFRNKPLVVVGGGDSAVEEADYLSKFASVTHMVHRRDQLRASKIMAKRALDNPKINVQWNRTLAEVLGNDKEGVTGARLASTVGEPDLVLDVSGVFLAIGHTPNTAFLKDKLELTPKGYIEWTTPWRTCTSVEGVFAAGDVGDDY